MKVIVGDVFIPKISAYCQDCLWVDRPTLSPSYTNLLRRTKAHVAKTGHSAVVDRLFRNNVDPA